MSIVLDVCDPAKPGRRFEVPRPLPGNPLPGFPRLRAARRVRQLHGRGHAENERKRAVWRAGRRASGLADGRCGALYCLGPLAWRVFRGFVFLRWVTVLGLRFYVGLGFRVNSIGSRVLGF